VAAEVRGGLLVSKRAAEKWDVERLNFKKLIEEEAEVQYQIKI
jgi:hypothetical protein